MMKERRRQIEKSKAGCFVQPALDFSICRRRSFIIILKNKKIPTLLERCPLREDEDDDALSHPRRDCDDEDDMIELFAIVRSYRIELFRSRLRMGCQPTPNHNFGYDRYPEKQSRMILHGVVLGLGHGRGANARVNSNRQSFVHSETAFVHSETRTGLFYSHLWNETVICGTRSTVIRIDSHLWNENGAILRPFLEQPSLHCRHIEPNFYIQPALHCTPAQDPGTKNYFAEHPRPPHIAKLQKAVTFFQKLAVCFSRRCDLGNKPDFIVVVDVDQSMRFQQVQSVLHERRESPIGRHTQHTIFILGLPLWEPNQYL